MEGKGEGVEPKKKRVESLGWLTESTIMPKKHKAIDGVGASSILQLKAQLYRSQEEAKRAKDLAPIDQQFQRAKPKTLSNDVFSNTNPGVQTRAHKDKLELKAVNDGSASYVALERKAELYDKLLKGELPDEEEKEKYCVDFFQKGFEQEKPEQRPQGGETSPGTSAQNENDNTDSSVLFSANPSGPASTADRLDNDKHKLFIREVHEEANLAREKTTALKLRRQEQTTARRDKLRQAHLLKQLEKLKTAAIVREPNRWKRVKVWTEYDVR